MAVKCKELLYTPVDALSFRITGGTHLSKTTKNNPSPDYVMFVFDIPKRCIRNYNRFINGKYSKFSKEYKIDILDFHDAEIEDEIGQILFQSDKRRVALEKKLAADLPDESELLSIINIEDETYNPEMYKFKKLI